MADPSREQQSEPPANFAQVPPPDIAAGTGQLRLIVQELKDDIKDIKSHRHSDFVFHVSVLAGGFLLLATMLIVGYFRLDDRIQGLATTATRVDVKLEDLLQRIPPVPTPPPAKR